MTNFKSGCTRDRFLYLLKIFFLHQSLPAYVHLPHVWNIILKGRVLKIIVCDLLGFGDLIVKLDISTFPMVFSSIVVICSRKRSTSCSSSSLSVELQYIMTKKNTTLKIFFYRCEIVTWTFSHPRRRFPSPH